jgi:hypothetical protein
VRIHGEQSWKFMTSMDADPACAMAMPDERTRSFDHEHGGERCSQAEYNEKTIHLGEVIVEP